MKKLFDLNIEKILEDWDVYQAIREILTNAFDEQIITNTEPVEIEIINKGYWKIRDFGRGIKPSHLTQKENQEKLKCDQLIGKFGICLKGALATFERKNAVCSAYSERIKRFYLTQLISISLKN